MDQQFEWDERKRLATLDKHGIDFIDAVEIFASDYLELAGISLQEDRLRAVSRLNGITITVIFTVRGGAIRIITARRARKDERTEYQIHVAGRNSAAERAH